jgi:hypothetical protein
MLLKTSVIHTAKYLIVSLQERPARLLSDCVGFLPHRAHEQWKSEDVVMWSFVHCVVFRAICD